MTATRIARRFAALKAENRAGLVTYLVAGDPDPATSFTLIAGLPKAGADILEIGMPFSDPMADGPAIQAAGLRALKAGMTLRGTLALVRKFRENDDTTPIVLMGYYNPIYRYGVAPFLVDAKAAGVDGLIVVDLPPEEDDELFNPTLSSGIDFIRLTTPTTDDARLPVVLDRATGFVYYVAISGITGTKSAAASIRWRVGVSIFPITFSIVARAPSQCVTCVRSGPATPGKKYFAPPANPATSCGTVAPKTRTVS